MSLRLNNGEELTTCFDNRQGQVLYRLSELERLVDPCENLGPSCAFMLWFGGLFQTISLALFFIRPLECCDVFFPVVFDVLCPDVRWPFGLPG